MKPLLEKTVVVTRPREQAQDLRRELENLGATVILFPTIEIVPPDSYADLDRAVCDLSNYDWLVFTSANAAEHFLRRLAANDLETAELDLVRVCAIGEATFERLRLAQVHVDILPTNKSAEGVFAAIAEYLGGENELKDLRFLLPRSEIARETLPNKLRASGALVDDIAVYKTVLPAKSETGKIKAMLKTNAVDCIAFASPSSFVNFAEILKNENLFELLQDVTLACIGETTAQTVRENGFTARVVAAEPSAAAFAQAVARALSDTD